MNPYNKNNKIAHKVVKDRKAKKKIEKKTCKNCATPHWKILHKY